MSKNLIPIRVSYHPDSSVWTMASDDAEFSKLSFKLTRDKLRKLLVHMKTKDSITYPNSKKGTTYNTMIDDIISKETSILYVWKSKCPTSIYDIQKLIFEEA